MRFFCIGDMNIGTTTDFITEIEHASKIFYDAVKYEPSLQRLQRGSYLFMKKNGDICDQKLDKVWVDKENADHTFVKILYVDHFLEKHEGNLYKREDMISKVNGRIQINTISDHS